MSKRILYQILQATQYSKTISEIAEKLYFSQPYLSKVLKNAEKEYGVTLIKRNTTPISLTNSGLIVLQHLQVILKTEDDLEHALKNQITTMSIKILVTNPFLYDLVLDLMTPYILENSNIAFEINAYPITNSLKAIQDHSFDIAIGRRYIDEQVITKKIPQNQVFTFISNSCEVYDSSKLILPFKSEYLESLKDASFVAPENSDGIQNYILNRFTEVGIQVKNTIKVDTVSHACLMAKSLGHTAMTLVSNYVAEKIAGKNNYNLMALPDDTLHLDNAIMTNQESRLEVKKLAQYLQREITSQINQENELLTLSTAY
ncbi:DNA-binding transcriptional LysR family regulator [Lactobacillus colini]|uniref:DNA-binding transcriptional LysR family regulator n=1 Tax=Lactobacillus colini TaxID=1819254 RepID=A0ABS4MEX9_9LACO|nr:LysR family transcriptional regulator [Lactobacillus colini]MBP2058245.1 DNA-binding transcriptional LysR family regulator [Lactobacillus colini]